jgi:hypothetical protein
MTRERDPAGPAAIRKEAARAVRSPGEDVHETREHARVLREREDRTWPPTGWSFD